MKHRIFLTHNNLFPTFTGVYCAIARRHPRALPSRKHLVRAFVRLKNGALARDILKTLAYFYNLR